MKTHHGAFYRAGWATLVILSVIETRAQTQVDLAKQTKNVDFSTAATTKPAKTSATLPAACATGEYLFLTSAAPGRNTYACTATNTWTVQGGGATSVFGRTGAVVKAEGDYNLADLGDVSGVKGNTGTVQLFGGGATTASDCAMFDAAGNLVSAGAPCGTGSGGGGSLTVNAGFGVLTSTTGSTTTVSVDTAAVPSFLTANAVIDFPSIAAASCGEQTMTLTGAAIGDGIAAGWPGALENGLAASARVSAANTITFRLCNVTAGAINPNSASFRATILRSF